MAVSTGATASTAAATEYGWHPLRLPWDKTLTDVRDECHVCRAIDRDGTISYPTGGRGQSHDLEVSLGIEHVPPGFYEVKRLHVKKGKYVDKRFKAGQRGERIYGRRDAEIKSFATALENFIDGVWDQTRPWKGMEPESDIHWGVETVTAVHDFIDQALTRKHGKRFHERLLRLAKAASEIPTLLTPSWNILKGGVRPQDIEAGFSSLGGIFIIADHIYTLVKPKEYTRFIGFDSASAEGPKLSYQGVVPLDKFGKVKG